MENPYEPPKTVSKTDLVVPNSRLRRSAPVVGCATGGCLIPFALLLISSYFGDIGGILVWPILAFFLGSIGMLVGLSFRFGNKPKFEQDDE